jgi:hypothetical protein
MGKSGDVMGNKDDKSYMAMGARSPRQGEWQWVTVGFEQVLFIAAQEPAFLAALLRDRNEAIEKRGLRLTAAEQSVLFAVSDAQLRKMVERIDVSKATLKQGSFMQKVATTVVTLAAGTTLVACDSPRPVVSKGISPEYQVTPSPPVVDPDDPLAPADLKPPGVHPAPLAPETGQKPPGDTAKEQKPEATPKARPKKTAPAKVPVKPERLPTRGHTRR